MTVEHLPLYQDYLQGVAIFLWISFNYMFLNDYIANERYNCMAKMTVWVILLCSILIESAIIYSPFNTALK